MERLAYLARNRFFVFTDSCILVLTLSTALLLTACGTGSGPTLKLQTQTITFGTVSAQTVGKPLALLATASSGLPVSFASMTPTVCTVSGSTASFIAGGTCTIQATQAGNSSTYTAAAPVSQSFTVSPEAQTITFGTISAQTVGKPLALLATASSGLPVSFGSMTPTVCTVSGSTASFIAGGTCTIQVTQAGNSAYAAAAPVSQSFTVNAEAQSITFDAVTAQTVGKPLALLAMASSGLPVSFASMTPDVCTVSGSTATFLTGGSCIIQATQQGNSTYAAAAPVSQSVAVNAEAQTITFGTVSAQTVGKPLALLATASSGLPVSFASMTPAVCTVSGSTASFITGGTCTIQATQEGNSTYAAAAPVSQSFTVSPEAQTITFGTISAQTVGKPLMLLATASSGLPVSFASMTPAVCTVSGSTASFIAGGTCTIQATQAGNSSTYTAAAAVSQSFTVSPEAQTITFGTISAQTVGKPLTLLATASSGLPVSFASMTPVICTVSGSTASFITDGTCAIQATQTGNSAYTAAAPVSQSFPVGNLDDTMLVNSQLAAGDQARMQRLIQKGRNGTPVTIAVIGGSITTCTGASDRAHCYVNLIQSWWNSNFPSSPSTLVNAGAGGTASDYGSLRLQRDLLSHNPDLVIVEFAVNDKSDFGYRETYEGLVRQLLDAPSHPAVVLLFMMNYHLPNVESILTRQEFQAPIGAYYNLPMVSYFNAIDPELTNGSITLEEITPDGTHPTDMGHAYAAQFVEQNIQNAIDNFPPGATLEAIPPTPGPLYSSDFEFVSLMDGIGTNGPPLDPTSNVGWVAEPAVHDDPVLGKNVSPGLQSSAPGSTLDFTVTGKEILVGYWVNPGSLGQASVTVDGVAAPRILDGWKNGTTPHRAMSRVATGLTSGPHHVHIELLSSTGSDSTGNIFRVVCVGTGGAQ